MALPFSHSGCIEVRGLHDPKAALLKIEHRFDRLKVRRVVCIGQQVQFSAGTLQSMTGRTALGTAGSGEVSVQALKTGLKIEYRLGFVQLFWVSVFMVGFASLLVLAAPNLTPREAVVLLLGMWLWIYGVNVVVTLFRFRRWLRGAVEPS